MENTIYNWSFSDDKNRWILWYILAISIIIWLTFWWIIAWQYWLSLVIILIAWVSLFIENNSEKIIFVEITTLWIKIWEIFYDFSKINSFYFVYDKQNAVYLRLSLSKKWIKTINLKVDNKICEDLKQILPSIIKEEKDWDLSTWEKIINILKL